MRRPLGVGQVGGASWLLLPERGHSKVLDQLLTQKEKGDLGSEPCVGSTSFPRAWGTLALIQGTWRGVREQSIPPSSSICGNSWEGLGTGIIRAL